MTEPQKEIQPSLTSSLKRSAPVLLPPDKSTNMDPPPRVESNGEHTSGYGVTFEQPASKRVKVEERASTATVTANKVDVKAENGTSSVKIDSRDRVKGTASIKPEYLLHVTKPTANTTVDDDAAEGRLRADDRDQNNGNSRGGRKKKEKKEKGQNKGREFGSWFDAKRLCATRANSNEFSPKECRFGDKCNSLHDLRLYLKEGKNDDLTLYGGQCPVFEVNGSCHAGWKCRFAKSHSKEIQREDGRMELVLIDNRPPSEAAEQDFEFRKGVHNVVNTANKLALAKRKVETPKSDTYLKWLDNDAQEMDKVYQRKNGEQEEKQENAAQFVEPPLRPSEKRRIYFGPETPVLAPLTTQGNLPFRRMCVDFGAQLTYSEMAMSIPLIQGTKPEWALMKAHESELAPPRYKPTEIVQGYDHSTDIKFGAQISANKPWQAIKAAEIMTSLLPNLRVIDLNCGCPIDLVFQTGAGSALLDSNSKLEKMIRGMSLVSGSVPVTAKIRMGTKTDKPTAQKTIERLAFGGLDVRERLGAPGCAAITLHGRSRQQRYTKLADWEYISECAALVKSYNKKKDDLTDTSNEPDARTQANGGKLFFIGNGDCYSHIDFNNHIRNAGVDSVMVARGALIKPWIFEEIESGQYLDKSASERLSYIEKFTRYGLEAWGSDEVGVGQTRRFLLEWLSFAHRYVPLGLLEHLPPSLNDRPPAYRGRNEMETLLASENYLDWIKISEMFLGPSHKDFRFQPKHKSNSYEIEAEG